MAYSKLSSFDVRGRISSSTQGMVMGTFETMPVPSNSYYGLVVQYLGDSTSEFLKNHLYKCKYFEGVFSWEDVSPVSEKRFTPNMVLTSDENGLSVASEVSIDELDALDGLTGSIQGQIDDLSDAITQGLADKVDKEAGKGLSEEDFTSSEKTKLSSVSVGAQVNNIDEIQLNGNTVVPTNKIVNLSVLEGFTYPVGNLTTGQGFIVHHNLNRTIFSVSVRDSAGKVISGTYTADNNDASIIAGENATGCTMYLIAGGI